MTKSNDTKIEKLKMLWAEWIKNGYGSYPHDDVANIIFDSEEEIELALENYDRIKGEEDDFNQSIQKI